RCSTRRAFRHDHDRICRASQGVDGDWQIAICSLGSLIRDGEFFFSSRRRHTRSVSAFLLNRSSDLGSVDPNFGRRVRNRRQLNSLQNTWPYGYSMPIAVRYTQDAFSRSGWLWPVDAKGEPLKATSYMAVGFYVA